MLWIIRLRVRQHEEGIAGSVFQGEYGAVSPGELGFSEPGSLIGKGGAKRAKFDDGDPGDDVFIACLLLRPPRAVFGEDDQRAASQTGKHGLPQRFRYLGQGSVGQFRHSQQKWPR